MNLHKRLRHHNKIQFKLAMKDKRTTLKKIPDSRFLSSSPALHYRLCLLKALLRQHIFLGPNRYYLPISAYCRYISIYWCRHICSLISTDIKTVFLRLKKNTWTSDLQWCKHVIFSAEGGPLFNW